MSAKGLLSSYAHSLIILDEMPPGPPALPALVFFEAFHRLQNPRQWGRD